MKINITICTYNDGLRIGKAIESVLAQDFEDYTLTIIDDGSSDSTREVVSDYLEMDNLSYVRLGKNVGVGQARNLSLLISNYDAISFLDADDQYLPSKISTQVGIMRANRQPLHQNLRNQSPLADHNEIDYVYCQVEHVDLDGSTMTMGRIQNLFAHHFPNVINPSVNRFDTVLLTPALINKRVFEQLGGFAPARTGEDEDLKLRSLMFGHNCYFLEESLYRYIRREGSLSLGGQSDLPDKTDLGIDEFIDRKRGMRSTLSETEYADQFKHLVNLDKIEIDEISNSAILKLQETIPMTSKTKDLLISRIDKQ